MKITNIKKIITVDIIFFILFFSCNKDVQIDSYFIRKDKLFSKKIIPLKDLYVKLPRIYNLSDSTLIISALSMNFTSLDFMAYIVSKGNGEIIKKLVKGGRGPNELTTLSTVEVSYNKLFFYDPMSRKVLSYNWELDSLNFQIIGHQKKYSYRNFYLIDSNKFVSSGIFGQNMYCYGDLSTGERLFYLRYPYLPNIAKEKQIDNSLGRSYAYDGWLIKRPNENRFAYFANRAGYLQIIKIAGRSIEEVMHWNFAPPLGKMVYMVDAFIWKHDKSKSIVHFIYGTSSEKYIYLLYNGQSNIDEEYGKMIFVFDWNGNKIKLLELDQKVQAITIDKGDQNIYAISTNIKTLKNEIIQYVL